MINEKNDNPSSNLLLNVNTNKPNPLKYQYSFTDSILLDEGYFNEFKVCNFS